MHTFEGQNIRIIHYGDYRGECDIINKNTQEEIANIRCQDLIDFAAQYVRNRKISELESMSSNEILGLECDFMEWKDLSNKAKAIIEWVENPYTHEKETVEIKIGEIFHRDCPKLCGDYSGDDLKCDIPVTKELYQEILRYVTEDDNIQCEQFMDGLLIFRLKDIK